MLTLYNDEGFALAEGRQRLCLFALNCTRLKNQPPQHLAVFTHQDSDLSPDEMSCNKGQPYVTDPTKLRPPSSCLNMATQPASAMPSVFLRVSGQCEDVKGGNERCFSVLGAHIWYPSLLSEGLTGSTLRNVDCSLSSTLYTLNKKNISIRSTVFFSLYKGLLLNLLKPADYVMHQQFNLLRTKRRPLYLKIQSVPRSKHFISVIKSTQFML